MSDCDNCATGPCSRRRRWTAPRRDVPLSGVLNVDKPLGVTSHDVVDAIRRMAGQRKVGHAGTLDPMASGVLLVCLGQATRVTEYLAAGRKRYRATVLVGQTTTTHDLEGEVVTSGGRTDLSQTELESALAGFRGTIEQVPPMYSAVKRGGEPLYKIARRGEEVERAPRNVTIYDLTLVDWAQPLAIIDLTCSPGTYVRSLAHDLGQRLGSGACLAALVRLASGRFALEDAVSLDRLEEAFQHGQEADYLLPADEALLDLPAMILSAADARRLVQGQLVPGSLPAVGDGREHRAYSSDGDFLAVAAYDPVARGWRPRKVFAL